MNADVHKVLMVGILYERYALTNDLGYVLRKCTNSTISVGSYVKPMAAKTYLAFVVVVTRIQLLDTNNLILCFSV